MVSEVTSFDWEVDSSRLTQEIPQMLSEQVNNNCNSTAPLKTIFTIRKTVTEPTKFVDSGEFRSDFTFEAKIPFVAKMDMEASISFGGTKSWGSVEMNQITETFQDSIEVVVPPGEAIHVQAMTMISNMDVPYTMTVKTAVNTIRIVKGIWKGASMTEMQKTQTNIPCSML